MDAKSKKPGQDRPEQPRGAPFLDYLGAEIWPAVRPSELGRRLSRREEEEILGIGPEGV